MENAPAIVCRGLTKAFGDPPQEVLHGIDLTISAGELVAMTGKSGSGKSTLVYVLSGLDYPSAGEVALLGRPVTEMTPEEAHHMRNLHMGFVFQFHYLLPELTALENVLMPARKFGLLEERTPRALDLLDEFEVDHCRDKRPSQMSGGEQQRVAVARALIMEPRLLFADEPTGNLDSVNSAKVMALLERANRELGTTVVYITHDPDLAARAHRVVELLDGRLVA